MSGCGSIYLAGPIPFTIGAYYLGIFVYSLGVGVTPAGNRRPKWIDRRDRPWDFSATASMNLTIGVMFLAMSALAMRADLFAQLIQLGLLYGLSSQQVFATCLVALAFVWLIGFLSVELFMTVREQRYIERRDNRTQQLLAERRARVTRVITSEVSNLN